jgi:hypothetical protein
MRTRNFSKKHEVQMPISRIFSLLAVGDWEVPETSLLEPSGSELSDSDFVMVEYREWTDEELMDDARRGRRFVRDLQQGGEEADEVQETSAMTTLEEERGASDKNCEESGEKEEMRSYVETRCRR